MDNKLFAVLAQVAEWRACEFKSQGLANTAWAFATAGQPNEKLFTALARASEQRVNEFNAQVLANMAWSFAKVD